MKKIISLFARNYDGDRLVRDEIVPGAEWVVNGEGFATEKVDGTSCLVRDGVLYKRYDAKHGKAPPPNFEAAQEPDPVTGHWPGWIPVEWEPSSLYHLEEWCYHKHQALHEMPDWTYELIGPRVQGNPYRLAHHVLERHGIRYLMKDATPPRDFESLREWFIENVIEGIVWWRDITDPDSEKVKIKRRDFGLAWPVAPEGVNP